MTAQVADKIIIKGVTYVLFTNPLDEYWTKQNPKPGTRLTTTACWRGYVATWEISENSLYLIDIVYYTLDGDRGLDYLFPLNSGKIKAVWFTGTLRIPFGKCINYVHGDYESIYESDLLIKIRRGNFKSQSYKANY